MSLIIPDDLLSAAKLSEQAMAVEVAILLYQQNRVSLGKAARFAKLDRCALQQIMALRGVPINYDVHEFEADLATLRELRKQWPSSATLHR
ncbi:UPF0175 family protein [Longimicrobium terrae]|uniref:Putative HTH domain antitoxin n=1 Tax=Longimicrobium terrae TaxID=1639882 RepID=A0A841H400_9BACT|nr:UPF0175 family protein [Longimicrobium terrae]MBB4638585.1 putative HTH domain antitoxin [Longimicrobium terrae]MBB6072777.1 putative HTH domain antitoxin [Longimicrobium terrae]NNC30604.1 UPF0175 family protein [Longimicrobium terrae]